MFWMLMQVVTLLIAVPFLILTHLVPALFQVCIWLTLPAFTFIVQLAGRQLARGALIVLSSLLWGGGTLVFMPILDWLLPSLVAGLILFGVGGMWGLSVGYQAALRWELDQLRLPDTDPGRQFSLPPHWFGSTATSQDPRTMDELVNDGIILGQTEDEW